MPLAGERQVLAELELTSVIAARVHVDAIGGSAPDSRSPTGGRSPADYWRNQLDAAAEHDRPRVLAGAAEELAAIRRRRFPIAPVRDGNDLRERVLTAGEGFEPADVALTLRCTPTFVRRTRLADGRDAQHGRRVRAGTPAALRAAGFSLRAIAATTGVPRSTLAYRLNH